jgi:SOS-response transcriptional repressor LexA
MLQGTGCSMHEPYALQVLGPDMEPEFPDRCVVIIEPTEECRSGMYIFAEVEGVRWFRQYKRDADGRERLLALNERFPAIELTGLEWKVLGVIIQRNVRRAVKHYEYKDAGALSTAQQTGIDAIDITQRRA